MKLFFIVFLTTLVLANVDSRLTRRPPGRGRIITGKPASLGQFPWQVLIKRANDVWCGGSIISENWVLTAAHCTKGIKSLNLVFGIINIKQPGVTMKVTEFKEHPQYNSINLNNDVSLIKLPEPLKFSDTMKPITLDKNDKKYIGQLCTVSGWGYTNDEDLIYSDNLLYANVNVIEKKQCEEYYKDNQITDDTLCTVGSNNSDESICSGDSGGALVIYDGGATIQIGINSFVAAEICTEKIPAGFVRVSSFIDFIQETTKLSL